MKFQQLYHIFTAPETVCLKTDVRKIYALSLNRGSSGSDRGTLNSISKETPVSSLPTTLANRHTILELNMYQHFVVFPVPLQCSEKEYFYVTLSGDFNTGAASITVFGV